MGAALITIAGTVLFVLIAIVGLGLGAALGKRTPLKGSCHGSTCSASGDEGLCRCGNAGGRSHDALL